MVINGIRTHKQKEFIWKNRKYTIQLRYLHYANCLTVSVEDHFFFFRVQKKKKERLLLLLAIYMTATVKVAFCSFLRIEQTPNDVIWTSGCEFGGSICEHDLEPLDST